MNIRIYADGADLETIARLADDKRIAGFTTNPSLMRKAAIADYREFAKRVLAVVGAKPVSLEVFADDMTGMERQAQEIASWGGNVYVKIPITNTAGESTAEVIEHLVAIGVKVNVTAILTREQIKTAINALDGADGIVSVFAGRIADAGKNPVTPVLYAVGRRVGETKILWASTREVYNVVQADECGCDIITCSPAIIAKLGGIGQDLTQRSLETVKEFFNDGKGYSI